MWNPSRTVCKFGGVKFRSCRRRRRREVVVRIVSDAVGHVVDVAVMAWATVSMTVSVTVSVTASDSNGVGDGKVVAIGYGVGDSVVDDVVCAYEAERGWSSEICNLHFPSHAESVTPLVVHLCCIHRLVSHAMHQGYFAHMPAWVASRQWRGCTKAQINNNKTAFKLNVDERMNARADWIVLFTVHSTRCM
jgi:hypothetical protein